MMTRLRLLCLLILVPLLAACSVFDGDVDGGGETGSPGGESPPRSSVSVDWDHSPYAIVFRAEVVGGEDDGAFYRRNDVPLCTIYGDGRMVWTTETGTGFEVVYDQISDTQIAIFADYLISQRDIYSYTAEADLDFSTTAPVVEVITLNVNNRPHTTDALGGWDYQYFEDVLRNCQGLGRQPTIFEPAEGWISAQVATYDATVPFNVWSAEATGIDLGELAASGDRTWIDNERLARALWRWIHRSAPNIQFGQGDAVYYVALEVPGVTRFAPAPPETAATE